jgi:hypothetical protein
MCCANVEKGTDSKFARQKASFLDKDEPEKENSISSLKMYAFLSALLYPAQNCEFLPASGLEEN